jgi:hypothetical protein
VSFVESRIRGVQRAYRQSTRLLSALALIVGVVLVAVTVAGGGGPLARGVMLGIMLAALGAGRLALARDASRRQ